MINNAIIAPECVSAIEIVFFLTERSEAWEQIRPCYFYIAVMLFLHLLIKALAILYKLWRPKGFIQFEIIINVLVISFRFI